VLTVQAASLKAAIGGLQQLVGGAGDFSRMAVPDPVRAHPAAGKVPRFKPHTPLPKSALTGELTPSVRGASEDATTTGANDHDDFFKTS
jgi:hypothetical protein